MPNDCCTSCCIDGEDCEVVKTLQHHSLTRQIFASTMASVISTLSLNPITVVKVRLQNLSSVSISPTQGAPSLSKTPLRDVFRTVLSSQGIAGFWSGTRTGMVMTLPNTVLYMSVYEHLKEKFANEPNLQPVRAITPAFAGAMARVVSVTIISPLEMVRTIQTGGASQSISTIVRSIVEKDGLRGLYRGWAPSILRDCPFSAIYWLGFETLRPVYSKICLPPPASNSSSNCGEGVDHARDGFPAFVTFLSGATAGMVAAVSTHPFDVLKTRQQTYAWSSASSNTNTSSSSSSSSSSGTTNNSNSTVGSGSSSGNSVNNTKFNSSGSGGVAPTRPNFTLSEIYRSEGIKALYRGLSMRLATVIPASAIMVTIYETIKRFDFDL